VQIAVPKFTNHMTCRHIADALVTSFDWSKTTEGYTYWNDLYHRFKELGTP
jgi:hypothetical protein